MADSLLQLSRGFAYLFLSISVALPVSIARAQDTVGEVAPANSVSALRPEPANAVTKHTIEIGGAHIAYTATVGAVAVADRDETVKAQIFYTSYVSDPAGERNRPLAFVFNGGPGAASAYLHIGALGPRQIITGDDGTVAAPPHGVMSNPMTWLAFTDLVFVDPVGTGFSRPAMIDGKPVPNTEFWSVDKDVDWLARFIRQYLTRAKRWGSPKFIVGESYGGFRVARLAELLPKRYGVALNGIVMISPFLESSLFRGDDRLDLWPAVLRLPSFAAVAWHHGRVGRGPRDAAARDRFLAEVEAFSLTEMLPMLAQGHGLATDRQQAFYARIAALTGLPVTTVERAEGRVPREVFIKEILADHGRVVGRYDGSVSIPDPNPGAPRFRDTDPTLGGLTAPFLTAINAYIRDELKFSTDTDYVLLSSSANSNWDWRSSQRGGGAALGSVASLRSGMIANPSLRVLIVHGRFDLITPYFVSAYIVNQIQLDASLRRNLMLELYDGGHMMYLHRTERERLFHDARDFFAASVPR